MRLDPDAIDLAPGPDWCRAWTAQVDEALHAWSAEGEQRGLAIVALGSFARRELCPASDVDLLLLHAGWGRADLSDLVQRLCYPLWDAGLQVGHAVRTPAEAVAAAGDHLDTATALADRRLVAGDSGLLDDLASRAGRWLRRNAARLLTELAEADAHRHLRAGDRAGMLEPHLKDGAGGLRDLHGLRWAAACLLGEAGLDPLVSAQYLGAAGRRELALAGHTLLSARCALHLARGAGGRPGSAELDRLRLDLQDEVAARLGLDAGEKLLREVGLATRTVAYFAERVRPLLIEDARGGRRRLRARSARGGRPLGPGLSLLDGAVAVEDGFQLVASLGLRAVAAAGRRGVRLHRHSAERLRREIADAGTLPWDEPAREALLDLLRAGAGALPAFADADFLGLLPAHLPEWARVRGRPQRNPFHIYDLDTHLHQTVAQVVDLGQGAALPEGLADPDTLLLAAWLHDVGKAWPGDHSVVGARVADEWLRRMGFGERRAERVARLVRHHLLLPDAAQHRDVDDEGELRRVADAVGDVEALDALYLLSLADSRATGPTAHSPWKDDLLRELHARVRRVFRSEPGPVLPGAAEVAAEVRGRGAESFLEAADARYLATAGAEQVLVHAELATPPPAVGELRASVRPGPVAGTVTLSIAAGDRRGLIADCAGVLAAADAEVLDARAFTVKGTALDWFVVRPRGAAIDQDRLISDLERAAAGALDVAAAVADRERRRDARPRPLAALVPVEIGFDLRGDVSRIDIRGPDAPGLLYRLTRVLTDTGLDLIGARVATLGPDVRDIFFVRGAATTDLTALTASLRTAATP